MPPETDTPRRRVLVTGANRGIGRGIVLDLARDHDVVAGVRDVPDEPGVEPGAKEFFIADLTDDEAIVRATAGLGPIDAVVHCAGVVAPLAGSVRERWRHVFEVNVLAVVQLTELLLPGLRDRGGHVVFINSGSGLHAWGDTTGYSASKFALTSYADGLRESERGRIRVSSVHPGRVDTDMQRDLQARLGRSYDPRDHLPVEAVVRAVRACLEAPDGATIERLSVRPS